MLSILTDKDRLLFLRNPQAPPVSNKKHQPGYGLKYTLYNAMLSTEIMSLLRFGEPPVETILQVNSYSTLGKMEHIEKAGM
jgi:hypothetical protein